MIVIIIQNGILNIYNFIIAIIAGLLCEKVGRRPLFIASTIGVSGPTRKSSQRVLILIPNRDVRVLGSADCMLRVVF